MLLEGRASRKRYTAQFCAESRSNGATLIGKSPLVLVA